MQCTWLAVQFADDTYVIVPAVNSDTPYTWTYECQHTWAEELHYLLEMRDKA